MKKITYFLFALLAVALFSCNEDDDNGGTNPGTEPSGFTRNFGASAQRDFIGQIVNTQNEPIPNVRVKIGNSEAMTDTNGVFIINQAGVYEKFAYITAERNGYIKGSRSLVPTNGKNRVKIVMIESDFITQTVASGQTSEVEFSNTAKVTFDGAFSDESGAAYTGNVTVSIYHLKPSNSRLESIMPGMLYAENADGNEVMLDTYGMLNVEMRGSGGQKLQLTAGHTAQIAMTIDPLQLAVAPETIPLWHFDEANGYWKEDGFATRQGNKYIGQVSHFSWWNCDAQFPTARLSMRVINQEDGPLTDMAVHLTMPSGSTAAAITDGNGQASGLIPINTVLTMKVYANTPCGRELIHTTQIGPFSGDTVLPDVVVDNTVSIQNAHIFGNLRNCNNAAVTNGYVMIPGVAIYPVTNGAFDFNTIICSNTIFSLYGFDNQAQMAANILTGNLSAENNVGNLLCCNAITESITYQIDNNPVVTIVAPTMIWTDFGIEGHFTAYDNPNFNFFDFWYYGLGGVGNYSIGSLAELTLNGAVYRVGATSAGGITITSFGENGRYTLTFSGIFEDEQQVNHFISGTINIYD